jgi:hypothetical protein
VRRALSGGGADAPLPVLLQVIEKVREREHAEPPQRRPEWTAVRAAVHVALARRDSRIALYDVKEALEAAAAPLPVDMLAALTLVGDRSCLEAVAAAAARSGDEWWRSRLLELFRTIAQREQVTPRHAVMKKILRRWPALKGELR